MASGPILRNPLPRRGGPLRAYGPTPVDHATVDPAGEIIRRCLRDVAPERLPMALAELHRGAPVGGELDLAVCGCDGFDRYDLDDDRLRDLLVGAGFEPAGVGRAGPAAAGRAASKGGLVARAR